MYDQIVELDWADAEHMAEEVLTLGETAVGDFMARWQHPDTFQKWHFRGRMVGAIALEVVLAIFSGGASLGLAVKSRAVRGYRAYPHTTKPGHHRIVQLSREDKVDDGYSGRRGSKEKSFPQGDSP